MNSLSQNPGTTAGQPPAASGHRLIVISLALCSLILAWVGMTVIGRSDPWYRNLDMNIHNVVDALSINSSVTPNPFAQPAVPLKYLLALDYRVRHELGVLPVWNMKKFGAAADPLLEYSPLVRAGRLQQRILILVFILCAAGLSYTVTREINAACLTVILLCGSSGLLFHGLLLRPELMCVGFGNVLALLCAWRATASVTWGRKQAWLFLAGLFVGLSVLEKLPGVFYLAVCYAWCWLAAVIAVREAPATAPEDGRAGYWSGLLPAASGVLVLWLVFQLGANHPALSAVAVQRLRGAALLVAVLPLLGLWRGGHRGARFLLERVRELGLLGAGALAALPLVYLLFRAVMTEPSASKYFAGVLHFVINPGPEMKLLLSAKPDAAREFLVAFREAPFLFLSAPALALAVLWVRAIPLRLKALLVLLLATALGLTLLMGRRHFFAQYSIFPHVPLLLVWSLGLTALGTWGRRQPGAGGVHWSVPVAFAAAVILALTAYLRLQPKYTFYQDDVSLPVNDLTLTFLFDHDAHPGPYLQTMRDHYGDRQQFTQNLQRYLADPANRY